MNVSNENFIKVKLWDSIYSKRVGVLEYFIFALIILNIFLFLQIDVFRFDELKYIPDYNLKLKEEGRWINFFLFPILKVLNIKIAIIINISCLFIFAFNSFKEFLEKKMAVLIALTVSIIPSYFLLNEWAQTLLPSFTLIALASLLYKKINFIAFFIIFAIAFNGVISHFYFLLPLLFICSKKIDWKIISVWIVSFIVGFLFAQLVVFSLTNEWINLIETRLPNPISSVEDFFENLIRSYNSLNNLLFNYTMYILIGLTIKSYYLSNAKKQTNVVCVMALILMFFSVFAQVIPYGITVSPRSTGVCYIVLIFLLASNLRRKTNELLIFLMIVCSIFSLQNYRNITYMKTINDVWKEDLLFLKTKHPQLENLVLLNGVSDMIQIERKMIETFSLKRDSTDPYNIPESWFPIAQNLNFNVSKDTFEKYQDEKFIYLNLYNYKLLDDKTAILYLKNRKM